jgi:hypothetical protein
MEGQRGLPTPASEIAARLPHAVAIERFLESFTEKETKV